MATRSNTLRTFLALLLATLLAVAGIDGLAVKDVQALGQLQSHPALSTVNDSVPVHALMSNLTGPSEECGTSAQCCPGHHTGCAALPAMVASVSCNAGNRIDFTPPFRLSPPSHAPFRPPIA